ncbi:MAG: DMT family transporter [Elusimicrobia bacterium]|nr:DMT family transporter [Elusimicrobiota bacterium]
MLKIYAAVACSILTWSMAFLCIKVALKELSPLELFLLRHLPLALGGVVYMLLHRRQEILNLLRQHPVIVIAASLCIPSYHWCLYKGQEKVSPALAALIVGASPILTFAIAALTRYERFDVKKLWGLTIAFTGLYCAIVLGSHRELYVKNALYLGFIFSAALISAASTIINRELAFKDRAINVLLLTIVLGTLPLLTVAPPGLWAKVFNLKISTWAGIAFLSVMSSFLGFMTWFYALKRLKATAIAVFINFIPFSTMVFGFLFFKETITIWLAIGGLLIAGGAYWVNRHA